MNPTMKYDKFMKKCDDKSSAWFYFLRAEDGQSGKCSICQKIIKSFGGSTSGMRVHLKSSHQIDLNNLKADSEFEAVPSLDSDRPGPSSSLTRSTRLQESTSIDLAQEDQRLSSEDLCGNPKKRKISEYFPSAYSMEITISRMVARDGLPFAKFCTSNDLRRLFEKSGYDRLPSTPKSIKNIVMNYSKIEKNKIIHEFKEMQKPGKKFSLTFDEWTSTRNRRYMNINVHSGISKFKDGTNFKNLGLIRVHGSMPAMTCISLLKKKLLEFDLSLDGDILAITTDGATVMCKVGRDINASHQLCLAHGVQLAVIDVLYVKKSTNTEFNISVTNTEEDNSGSESSGTEESEGLTVTYDESALRSYTIHPHYKDVITKVRSVVKLFSKSPTKNDEYLQKYVKQQEHKELSLILDCKTRWSSMANMIERFNRLRPSVLKALIDVKSNIKFTEEELTLLDSMQKSLTIIKLTVEALCRSDATLLTAHAALKFLFKKIYKQNTNLSAQLADSLRRRIAQRTTPLTSMLLYLHNPKTYFNEQNSPTQEGLTWKMGNDEMISNLSKLIKRFYPAQVDQSTRSVAPAESANTSDSDDSAGSSSIEKELCKAIKTSMQRTSLSQNLSEGIEDDDDLLTVLRIEMTLYENGGKRGRYLQELYEYLMTVSPTSVESERAFSAANYMCNKIRSSLNDDTLDAICFLRTLFQQQITNVIT